MLLNKKLQEEIDVLKKRVEDQSKEIVVLSKCVSDLMDKMREREDAVEEQAKEIRLWNEGISNILNYSLDVAKGEKK